MGTPAFAVPFLESLYTSEHRVVAVVTQPDRPRGRGMRPQPSPVKAWAQGRGLPVLQPQRVRDPAFLEELDRYQPEVIVLVAYGQLIPRELLELPPRGCINVHPSLLPRHRGATPIQAAILAGDQATGVTTMYMDEGLDTGDIILQTTVAIHPEDTAGTLEERLIAAGVPLLLETLRLVEAGQAPRRPQPEEGATYAPRLDKGAGFIDWTAPARHLDRVVRACTPSPGAYTWWKGRRIRIGRAVLATAEEEATPSEGVAASNASEGLPGRPEPGTILAVGPQGILVQAGEGALRLLEVQPANGRMMPALDFVNGYRLQPGQRFEAPPAAS